MSTKEYLQNYKSFQAINIISRYDIMQLQVYYILKPDFKTVSEIICLYLNIDETPCNNQTSNNFSKLSCALHINPYHSN